MKFSARSLRRVSTWARQHLALWITIASAVDAAAIALTTTLMQLPGQRETVITALFLILFVLLLLSIALPLGGYIAEKRLGLEAAKIARRNLLILGTPSNLPKLSMLSDVELGATATKYSKLGQAPYVRRETDDAAIAGLLENDGPPYPFVVVWGLSKSGKTRSTLEAARKVFAGDICVLRPVSGRALVELLRDPPAVKSQKDPILIWLDDASTDDFEELSASTLDLISNIGILLITMTAKRYADLTTSTGAVSSIGRLALLSARTYELEFRPPTSDEMLAAESLYPDERFQSSIAETLVGGAELIARYRASADLHPGGCAVIKAAVDARRIGLTRPLSESRLQSLFEIYLPKVRVGLQPNRQNFQEALMWASTPVSSQVAILSAETENGRQRAWRLLDHIVSVDDGRDGSLGREIPKEIWPAALEGSSHEEAFQIGITAAERNQDAYAIMGLQAAASSKDERLAARALFNLGIVHFRNKDYEDAELAYRLTIDYEDEDVGPLACANLGVVLSSAGRIEESVEFAQMAIDSEHRDARPLGAYNLAQHYASIGNDDAAIDCYGVIIEAKYPTYLPAAYLNTGAAYSRKGDRSQALRFYHLAHACRESADSTHAALNLGITYQELGDHSSAARFYQAAMQSEQEEHAARAVRGLVRMWTEIGNADEARAAYECALKQKHSEHKAIAAFDYGVFLTNNGGSEAEIEKALRLVMEIGEPDSAAHAAVVLAQHFIDAEQFERAIDLYEFALDLDQENLRILVARGFGKCFIRLRRYSEALNVYRDLIAEDVQDSSIACNVLGDHLAEVGEHELAKAAYQLAFDARHEEYAPRAAIGLALRLLEESDADSARVKLEYAINSQREPYCSLAQEIADDFFAK